MQGSSPVGGGTADPRRAREPDQSGFVVRDGVRSYYEVFGDGAPTILLLPTMPIVDSRHWKAQVPYLSRHYRVVTFDPRGNGRSDRPATAAQYGSDEFVGDALAVLDATGTEAAVVAGLCGGVRWAVLLADSHPERVLGLVAIAPGLPPLTPDHGFRAEHSFDAELEEYEGWAKCNRHYWRQDFRGWLEFHSAALLPEPHSSKVYDDAVAWGLQTDAEALVNSVDAPKWPSSEQDAVELCRRLRCPVLVIHGDEDCCQPLDRGRRFAELTGATLLVVPGGGHLVHARHPVLVNRAVRDFVDDVVPPAPRRSTWMFARERRPRALWVSSPIGLGHALRDVAMARALRERVPDLEIHWLAQHPVTRVLGEAGELVHPASDELASESAHWEQEAGGADGEAHDLHAFEAFRRLDEIFCANYMLFDDVVHEERYDLVVGDESWEVDHFLHENPDRKNAPYAFLTDVVGFLPVDGADEREIALCADYNAELLEHRERHPRLRDLSLFVGELDEMPDASFGPGLPAMREWSRSWYETVPYVVPFDPRRYQDPADLRRRLGHGTGYPLVVASVGGTSVGGRLLELTVESFRLLRKEIPDVRMLLVTGPRIEPDDLPDAEGIEKRGYVHDLFEHLACADAAVVQGGLSTTMELVAARRPFVYFPLRHHWEQQHFVAHRLDHYRAGIRLDYATTSPHDLAAAMDAALRSTSRYRAVPRDGAVQAAERLAGLLVP